MLLINREEPYIKTITVLKLLNFKIFFIEILIFSLNRSYNEVILNALNRQTTINNVRLNVLIVFTPMQHKWFTCYSNEVLSACHGENRTIMFHQTGRKGRRLELVFIMFLKKKLFKLIPKY